MMRKFTGTVTGNGLSGASAEGEFEETTGGPLPPRRVWIIWRGTHQFQLGEAYRIDLDDGRYYDARVVAVSPPVVRFETTP